ncbi:MAG: AAA family ATPase [Candidatus Omnitrophica bacterium]|nr:AAA family ATPase [Candidatus Omnitrophota bacterium]
MKVIAIANQKGGCGKTTTAINLSSALSHNGKRVLLLDLDPQAHATLGLDIKSQDSIYNVISQLTPRKLKVENIIKRVEDSFDLIPSNVLVGTLEQELANEIGRELKLSQAVSSIKDKYDYTIIDCPPSLGILTVNAIRLSDELIIPVETSRFSLQGVTHLMDIVMLIRERLGHDVRCRVLVTMFDSRLRHSFSMLSTFKKNFEGFLLDTIIHVNVKLKESAVYGKTVSAYDKYCRGSKDYNTLAKEIIFEAKQPIEANDKEALHVMSEKMQGLIKEETKSLLSYKFTLDAAEAKAVYVTGSFNDWSLDDKCRLVNKNGKWEGEMVLKPGIYEYQFIVDGVWQEDPGNPRKTRNSFGDINSLLEIG